MIASGRKEVHRKPLVQLLLEGKPFGTIFLNEISPAMSFEFRAVNDRRAIDASGATAQAFHRQPRMSDIIAQRLLSPGRGIGRRTSRPLARNSVLQLAPMTPAPRRPPFNLAHLSTPVTLSGLTAV